MYIPYHRPFTRRPMPAALALLVIALLLAACSGAPTAGDATAEPTREAEATTVPDEPEASETPAVEPTEAPVASSLISATDDVQEAVVQIETDGSIVPRGESQAFAVAGSGSGFIIDPSGLVVTNNHVVTGAARIRVYIGGKEKDPSGVRATVLGASECSDLAVLQLVDGGPYRYLEWFTDTLSVKQDVFALGFPDDPPEFTATRGIVSKARTQVRSSWASIDKAIEHDARLLPGNSGGPLVTPENQVIGINYAGTADTGRSFAIGRDEATPLIKELSAGNNVNSIGINAEAVEFEATSGIYVAGVDTGSPADLVGIKPGDIIPSLERSSVGDGGTMNDYCNTLITQGGADKPMTIAVYRPSTQEALEGQLNVPSRELKVVTSFADEQTADSSLEEYTAYTEIVDDSGTLVMQIPVEWNDRATSEWTVNGESVGLGLSAAPNLTEFKEGWRVPGVFFGVSRSLAANNNEQTLLDNAKFDDACVYGGRQPYQDQTYTGYYDIWRNCDRGSTQLVVLALVPENRSYLAFIQIQVVNNADYKALDRIINTFDVKGRIP